MKKLFLFGSVLCLCLGFLVSMVIAEDNPAKKDEKEIEGLIDETIKDVDKLVSQSSAQEQLEAGAKPAAPIQEKKETAEVLIDLEFTQANLEDVLRIIAEASGRNIVLDPALKGRKIDLHLKKTNVNEVLELLYNAYGLSPYSIGNIMFISTKEKIKEGTTKTKVVELKNINSEEAKALLGNLVTTINLSKETNTLVLVGAAEDVIKAEEILSKIDVPQPQVLLEAKIVEINDDAKRELGIDWPDQITISVQEAIRPQTLSGAQTTAHSPMYVYRLARNAIQFNAIIKMLEEKDKAKVLSSPKVTTMNNKEAEIFIGDKVPYTITTVTGGVASTEVRFVEPGIRLKITPSIIEEDFVVIKIEPEVSYIYSWRGANDEYPWVKARQATAYVRVENNQPFVLGGLLSNEDKKNLYSVPFLGKIPLLGNLFTYEKKTLYTTDLIITVTPTIISNKK